MSSKKSTEVRPELAALQARLNASLDAGRSKAVASRHSRGYRTARENLHDLIDPDSWIEWGQLAIAAQRSRRSVDDLRLATAADGIITGMASINARQVGPDCASTVVVVNDYTVLAGTQGYYHHHKLDRAIAQARQLKLPVVMYTEGGGGRPGDDDVKTQIAGLHLASFRDWAALGQWVPRITVNHGYCFAGNAALFGSGDIRIATRASWIGMAGPAMIEGGGLGRFEPTQIGPAEQQFKNGVVDILVDDEAEATAVAKQVLSYFQGAIAGSEPELAAHTLRDVIPEDRRWAYPVRQVIKGLCDKDTFLEVGRVYGRSVITGFIRIDGVPIGLIANDCQHLGGAVDAQAADKAARWYRLCQRFKIPLLSLTDTPGFMVGPDSEAQAAVTRMASMFEAGAAFDQPLVALFLRKGYGLGAMAMTGGSFAAPSYAAAWPTGEFGGMGLEGAVRLGYRKELEAIQDPAERQVRFDALVAQLYDLGKATEAATHLEIDAVIDPKDTRAFLLRAYRACGVL